MVGFHHLCGSCIWCQSTQVPLTWLADLGWICFDLYCYVYSCVRTPLTLLLVGERVKTSSPSSIVVTFYDRPVTAPQAGDFELSYYAIPYQFRDKNGSIIEHLHLFSRRIFGRAHSQLR